MEGVFEVNEVVAQRDIGGGGVLYRRDKYIRLTCAEWTKLFSVDFDFENPRPRLLLAETERLNKFVKVEYYNGVAYLDIRHWYYTNGEYQPSRQGVKLKENEWADIKKWVNSRG
jgi:hypothetical protein